MKLTPQQIDDFNREGWLFLPELFSPEEVAYLAREAEDIYDADRPRYGARRAARRAPPLPRISTTRLRRCSARIRA